MRPSQPGPDETRYLFRAIFARRVAVILGVLALSALLVTTTYTSVITRQTQVTNTTRAENDTRILASVSRVLREVRSCTKPTGDCFERGQSQTADAIATLSLNDILSAACADRPGTQTRRQIQACVMRAIESAQTD